MKRFSWRTALLFSCAFMFVCLLLSGAPRLIGSTQEETFPIPSAVKIAYLCSTSAAVQEIQFDNQERPQNEKHAIDVHAVSVCQGNPAITLKRDANGNILFHKSYLKTVYQAFSLGDGFV